MIIAIPLLHARKADNCVFLQNLSTFGLYSINYERLTTSFVEESLVNAAKRGVTLDLLMSNDM